MPVAHDRRELVGKGRVVGSQRRDRRGQQVAVAVLVLEPLAVERRAAGGRAHHEAAPAGVAERPRLVARPLEAEHRVEDVEGDHRLAVRGVRRGRGLERGHRAGLVDPLLQHLPVPRLAVGEDQVGVHRLVVLALAGVDPDLLEERVHAEGAGLVGDDRHDPPPEARVAHQVAQELGEDHRGAHGRPWSRRRTPRRSPAAAPAAAASARPGAAADPPSARRRSSRYSHLRASRARAGSRGRP